MGWLASRACSRQRRLQVEVLETRLALSGCDLDHDLHFLPAFAGAAPESTASAIVAVGALPVSASYSSLPSAAATLYLDFDGHFEAVWGSYSNINTPAYDTDGNAGSWSSAELDAIYQIWRQVAEDYAPFNINVTTVLPPSFANGVAQRVVIGGAGAWTGGSYGGVSYVDNFTSSVANTSFVFSANLGSGYPKYVAEATSHEAGHGFGLSHQSAYSGATRTNDYQSGPGDGTAPIMGNSYSASRGLWWFGASSSSTTLQNDMAVIARAANGFGYRPDEAGDTPSTAAGLTVSSTTLSGAGVITSHSDLDYWSFSAGPGTINLTVSVPSYGNLDARAQLVDANGVVIVGWTNPSNSGGVTLTGTVSGGAYRLVVASSGVSSNTTATNYGFNVGSYTITGVVPSATPTPGAFGDWTALSGSMTQITTAVNADGRLQVFAIGGDNAVWTRTQTAANGAFGAWTSLGGYVKQLVVDRNANGGLVLVAIGGDNAAWVRIQTAANGAFGAWSSLGGYVKQLAAGRYADGRLALFAIGGDNAAWMTVQTGANGAFGNWTSLGGYVKQLVVGSNANGGLVLFGIGGDNAAWARIQTSPNGSFAGWSSLGGYVTQLAVASNANGTQVLFAIGGDNAVWTMSQGTTNGAFAPWASLGGYVKQITVGRNANGSLLLFAIGGDDAAWVRTQTAPNGGFASWKSEGGSVRQVSTATNRDGTVALLAISWDQSLHTKKQVTPVT